MCSKLSSLIMTENFKLGIIFGFLITFVEILVGPITPEMSIIFKAIFILLICDLILKIIYLYKKKEKIKSGTLSTKFLTKAFKYFLIIVICYQASLIMAATMITPVMNYAEHARRLAFLIILLSEILSIKENLMGEEDKDDSFYRALIFVKKCIVNYLSKGGDKK